jgi:hypothetical protein
MAAPQMEWSRGAFQAGVDAWLKLTNHQSLVPEFLDRTDAIVDALIARGTPAADDASSAAELMRHYLGGHLDRERLVSETSALMLAGAPGEWSGRRGFPLAAPARLPARRCGGGGGVARRQAQGWSLCTLPAPWARRSSRVRRGRGGSQCWPVCPACSD